MREIGKDIITIDRDVRNDEHFDFEFVEYTLRVKSAVCFNLDEDEIVSNDYIVTCLINHLRNLLNNKDISFAIRGSIIEQRNIS